MPLNEWFQQAKPYRPSYRNQRSQNVWSNEFNPIYLSELITFVHFKIKTRKQLLSGHYLVTSEADCIVVGGGKKLETVDLYIPVSSNFLMMA